MKKKGNGILVISFIIYIFGFFILHITVRDKQFSDLENRKLAQNPQFSFEKLVSGEYTKKIEIYIAEQFPGRNKFISIKAYSELAMQKKYNNGVFIGKDGYLLQDFQNPDMNVFISNVDHINKFGEKFNTYFMLVPTATKVYQDKLPKFSEPFDEGKYINNVYNRFSDKINFIPLLEPLMHENQEYIYYKTDHHWTTLGAYYGYVEFCKNYGIRPLALDKFNIESTKGFYGSLFSKGNFIFAKADTLDIYEAKNKNTIEVNYLAENKIASSLYEKKHLERKDKYSTFLDNNHPVVIIKSSVKNGKKFMVIKDSYANCFIPFLTNHFEEIHVLDVRFLNMPISQYGKANNIKDSLILYNVQNFAKERGFTMLK